jgi:LAO/AO transport system kinase
MSIQKVEYYLEGIKKQDKTILAQAITLVESQNQDHAKVAAELLQKLIPQFGKSKKIAITGTPGVGKSTFIEKFGMRLIKNGHKMAIIAIDPTSFLSGGSIMGDKTRMNELAQSESAFIRPSPSGKGVGINPRTQEVIFLLDAFGFDYIFIETVGVGQTEIEVKSICDCFTFIQSPTAGDELQGIKRGIMEASDVILINKADNELENLANHFKSDILNALSITRSTQEVPVILCSSVTGKGYDELIKVYDHFFQNKKIQWDAKNWLKKRLIESFMNSLEGESSWQENLETHAKLLKKGEEDICQAISHLNKILL